MKTPEYEDWTESDMEPIEEIAGDDFYTAPVEDITSISLFCSCFAVQNMSISTPYLSQE